MFRFRTEKPRKTALVQAILGTLKTLHISCGRNCLEVTKSDQDFVGICILHEDGNKLLQDGGGRRVKSGYIFAEKSSELEAPTSTNTRHRQAYNKMFQDIEMQPGVEIVGFSQLGKTLKGTSGTFNSENCTNLLPGEKECLFSYRTLIFGAIIMHKLNGSRNITPHSACFCLTLFLIVKSTGDPEDLAKFPVSAIELQNQEIFLKEMFRGFNVDEGVLDVAFNYNQLMWGVRYFKAKWALKVLMEQCRADMTEEDFRGMMRGLCSVYDTNSFIGTILYWLLKIFGITL